MLLSIFVHTPNQTFNSLERFQKWHLTGRPAPPPILSFPFHPFRLHTQQDAGQRQKTFTIYRVKTLPTALSQCNRCNSWKPWAMIFTWNMLLFLVTADLHLHTLTSADLHLHTLTSADLHLHTLTSADLHLHTFTPADLHLHTLTSADLHLHTFTPADLHLHTLTSADLHLHTLTHLLQIYIFTPSHRSTSSHPHICRSTSSHLHICRSPLALLSISLLRRGRCRRSATKRNPFARNGRWTSKTEVKLRFNLVHRNPFARNGRWTSKTEEKLRFWVSPSQPFRTKWTLDVKNWGKIAI